MFEILSHSASVFIKYINRNISIIQSKGGLFYENNENLRTSHVLPDWLLIYRIEDDVLVLTLSRTGSHSDLFGK